MSKQQAARSKVVVPQKQAAGRAQTSRVNTPDKPAVFIFGKKNYILLAVGAALMILGILLMSGGQMPDPNTWDDQIIYSPRRMVLAPLLMLAGLVVEIFAIFRQ